MIDNWGKGRGRSRKREIGHGWVIGAISPVLGCDETSAIWDWVRWCDLGLDAVVRFGVVVRVGVGCGSAIWGCGVCNLVGSTLSCCSWFSSSFFFFFGNGLNVSLDMGFGPWGDTIWVGRSLVEVSLDMGFGPCEECARAFSLQVWFSEIVCRENQNVNDFTPGSPYFTVNAENNFSLTQFSVTTKYTHLRKNISGSGLKPK